MPDEAVQNRHWRRAVLMLFAVAAGTNVPTPLLLVSCGPPAGPASPNTLTRTS